MNPFKIKVIDFLQPLYIVFIILLIEPFIYIFGLWIINKFIWLEC